MAEWRVRNETTDSGEVMDIRSVMILGNVRPSSTCKMVRAVQSSTQIRG